jgi:hypothetical protein
MMKKTEQVPCTTTPHPKKEDFYDDYELKKQKAKKEIVLFQLREVSLRKQLDAATAELVSLQDKMHMMIRLAGVVLLAVVIESLMINLRGGISW